MKEVDWDNWTTGNFGHHFMFFVLGWNALEHTARVLLSAALESNDKTEVLFQDFQPAHLSNALKLAASKCEDEENSDELKYFSRAFDVLLATRNTVIHGFVAVLPSSDGLGCEGRVLGQKVRGKHELIDLHLTEEHLREFWTDCRGFTVFADHLISQLRPGEFNFKFAIKQAVQEFGDIDPPIGERPPLPNALQLNRLRI